MCFNLFDSQNIINFTAMVYLNQFKAVKCFLKKIVIMCNAILVPQNMKYVQHTISTKSLKPLT